MTSSLISKRLLVAVGSRHDRVCSIGAFARAEAKALESVFNGVEVLEPTASDHYPKLGKRRSPNVIFFHAPALHDRKKPWNALLSAAKLRAVFPKAKFISVVHEYSEAPSHWKVRQALLLKISHGVIVNSDADYQGVKPWNKKILRTRLGPTLFIEELLREDVTEQDVKNARTRASAAIGKSSDDKWILHPGLLTPGKGMNFLTKLAPFLKGPKGKAAKLVLMGGIGPKEKDREFARQTLNELRSVFGDRVLHIDSPDDEKFRNVLIASELVVLPYDNGLSERRSSFLSAASCGANIWTTLGQFSAALHPEQSGAHTIPVGQWLGDSTQAVDSVTKAFVEFEDEMMARRLKNLSWARTRSWKKRAEEIDSFISSLL